MDALVDMMMKFAIVLLGLVIVIYVAQAIFLSKFNKLVYDKKTIKGWIPIVNIYLLGKLTMNKLVGWILVLGAALNSQLTVTVNDKERVYNFLPEGIKEPFSVVYGLIIFILFIYAIIKYNKLKKEKERLDKAQLTPYDQMYNSKSAALQTGQNHQMGNLMGDNQIEPVQPEPVVQQPVMMQQVVQPMEQQVITQTVVMPVQTPVAQDFIPEIVIPQIQSETIQTQPEKINNSSAII